MPCHCTIEGKRVRRYGHKDVVLSFSKYLRNDRTCLRLLTVEDDTEGQPYAVCSVNLPNVVMNENEIAVKTWHENTGMLGWLVDEGIVSEPQRYASFANVFIPICSLLIRNDNLEA